MRRFSAPLIAGVSLLAGWAGAQEGGASFLPPPVEPIELPAASPQTSLPGLHRVAPPPPAEGDGGLPGDLSPGALPPSAPRTPPVPTPDYHKPLPPTLAAQLASTREAAQETVSGVVLEARGTTFKIVGGDGAQQVIELPPGSQLVDIAGTRLGTGLDVGVGDYLLRVGTDRTSGRPLFAWLPMGQQPAPSWAELEGGIEAAYRQAVGLLSASKGSSGGATPSPSTDAPPPQGTVPPR